MSSEKSGYFRWKEIAKQKAVQGAEIKLGMLKEGTERDRTERKVIDKIGEVGQVTDKLPVVSLRSHFPICKMETFIELTSAE